MIDRPVLLPFEYGTNAPQTREAIIQHGPREQTGHHIHRRSRRSLRASWRGRVRSVSPHQDRAPRANGRCGQRLQGRSDPRRNKHPLAAGCCHPPTIPAQSPHQPARRQRADEDVHAGSWPDAVRDDTGGLPHPGGHERGVLRQRYQHCSAGRVDAANPQDPDSHTLQKGLFANSKYPKNIQLTLRRSSSKARRNSLPVHQATPAPPKCPGSTSKQINSSNRLWLSKTSSKPSGAHDQPSAARISGEMMSGPWSSAARAVDIDTLLRRGLSVHIHTYIPCFIASCPRSILYRHLSLIHGSSVLVCCSLGWLGMALNCVLCAFCYKIY